MIPNAQKRDVQSGGVTESSVFGISVKDVASIMTILRDTLYSDKILAILREYSANAWDAHREIGKNDLPIQVTVPTSMNPTLGIRDFGPGLSHQSVFEVYTQYGASTKRGNDNSVGMLGIGSKSGFAYSDSFNITSWHGGTKRVYVAVIDDSEKGVINLLHEEDCGDETGVLIEIAARPEDIWEFHDKGRRLFQHFRPRPEINLDLPPLPPDHTVLSNGALWQGNGTWVAVMGCVPYRINLEQLRAQTSRVSEVGEHLTNVDGTLFFGIGEVTINASREELKYTTNTKKKIVDKIHALVDEYITTTLDALEKDTLPPWEKRLRAQVFHTLGLPVPKKYRGATETYVELNPYPVSFVVARNSQRTSRIEIKKEARLLLKDDQRAMAGFGLKDTDYLITPSFDSASWDIIKSELKVMLEVFGMTGIDIQNLSSIAWVPPAKRPGAKNKKVNNKHQRKSFRLLVSSSYFHHPYSTHWDIDTHVANEEDVFVVLSNFKAEGYDFYRHYREDLQLAETFSDGDLPPVYGYKSTLKKPLRPEDCVGRYYPEWRKSFIKSLLTPQVSKLLEKYRWSTIRNEHYSLEVAARKKEKGNYERLLAALGDDHLISYAVRTQYESYKFISKLGRGQETALESLDDRLQETDPKASAEMSEAHRVLETIFQTYPLLSLGGIRLDAMWGDDAAHWVQYVQTIDKTILYDPFKVIKKF